ncbi:ABC transporter ATP-binding protein [Streptomyces scabiei]|uniref:ABC transporter ATP-binding protein n=2 Tax=Streptomyces scabiei TaxID=1930 RepID=UPI001B31D1D6|nr:MULTISPECIES: ABC transporter ATP-binding protein [Streptomyces]MBP5889054.1 ABC transporter ATP-binding protein [Streptomyces sp. LBUM 1481]MBP5919072.1 ABC transporter ATP-binding protein [Streptomyces sp. LBUM 1483]MDX2690385.1 ABC transporter ATP-binding protein [Streptomyces scabiei]MDX2755190.1 ABC transporter ATP-binding protein [Streptomyces scabiei]MDX2806140.1 ABC transporter ATP-binding protein [Streptomyces scabiei]
MDRRRARRPARSPKTLRTHAADRAGDGPGGSSSLTAAHRAAVRLIRAALTADRGAALRLTWWTLLSAAPALVCGKALALAVDRGFLLDRPRTAALGLGVFALCAIGGAWAGRQSYPWLAEIVEPLRDRLLRDVVTGTLRRAVAPRAAPDDGAAVAVARLTRQVEAVRDALAGQLMLLWQFVLTVAAVIAGTAVLAPAAVPLVAVPLLAALVLFAVLAPATVRRQRAAFDAEEALAGRTVATFTALRDIVACGAQEHARDEALDAVDRHLRASNALASVSALRRLIVALGAHSPLLLVVLAAPGLHARGVSAGEIVGILAYVLATLEPAVRLLVQGLGASWLRLAVAAERLAEAAHHPVPGPDPDPALIPSDGSAALSGIVFAYGPGAEPVLDGLDLTLADGEHLAVVGPSGIGKSTLADVLAGMLPPDRGRVVLGGVPLERVTRDDLARARVLAPQTPYVVTATLRENLRYLAPDTSDAVLTATMTELGMDALAERLGGLDGPVDPAALSSGERALVALARVHLSDARLVILDEATRHLDATAERRVEEAFRRRPGTVVTVAHRMSVARRADRVLLLDGTRPAIGTHDTLLARVPLYADLMGHWHDGATGTGRPQTGRSGPGRTGDGLSTPGAASRRSSSRPAADPAP